VCNDWHVPDEDRRALRLLLDFVRQEKPRVIHLLGDIIDLPQLARFDDYLKRKAELSEDIECAAEYLAELRKASGQSCRIIYSFGNHEDRLVKYAMRRAPEAEEVLLEWALGALGLQRQRIQWVEYKKPYKHKGLWFFHGDKVSRHAGYTAKRTLEEVGGNIIIGHVHRLAFHSVRLWDRLLRAWENGCLCKRSMRYTHHPNWQQGFSVVHFQGRRFQVEQVEVQNGSLMYHGELRRVAR